MTRSLALLFAASALAACSHFLSPEPAPAATSSYERVVVADKIATPAERAACDAAGGEISRQGLMGYEHCVQAYPDAGAACRSSEDCLGDCRYTGSAAPGSSAEGTCQVQDVPFGCFSVIEDGVVQPALCVD